MSEAAPAPSSSPSSASPASASPSSSSPSSSSPSSSSPPSSGPELVLATHNPHKVTELRNILREAGLRNPVLGADEVGAPDVPETGITFAENALIKARAVAQFSGLAAVADDSGLVVDFLGAAPGVLSARWSGRHGDDAANLDLLLAQLREVPASHRQAHFRCAAAYVSAEGTEFVTEGVMEGMLLDVPRGLGGFGYDPIFVAAGQPGGQGLTNAELTPEAKNAISHRGQAFRALVRRLAALPRN